MDSAVERVAAMACNSILNRAFGRPRLEGEQKDSIEERIANMTREERLARIRELLEPTRQYLLELDEEQAGPKVTTLANGDQQRRRRPSAA